MLIAIQFPLIDVRPLVGDQTGRISAPSWPIPDVNHRQFVRGFGEVHLRPGGEVPGLRGEGYFASVARAIRVDQAALATRLGPFGHIRPLYRRMFCDGRVVARVEVGFELAPRTGNRLTDECLGALLGSTIRVRDATSGQFSDQPLWRIGRRLALSYLSATTSRKPTPPSPAHWWVSDGEPIVFVERTLLLGESPDSRVLAELSPYIASLEGRPGTETHIAREDLSIAGQRLTVWTLALDASTRRHERVTVGRRIRGHLLRLQAEVEALKHVLRLILARTLAVDANRTTQLEWYLRDASKLILSDSKGGFPQGPVFDELASTAAVVPIAAKAELTALLTSLGTTAQASVGDLLNSIRANLVVQGPTSSVGRSIDHLTVIAPMGNFYGDISMPNESKTITVGSGATVNAPIVIADSIERSFNTLAQSKVSEELKRALEQLLAAVAELSRSLPPARAAQVAQDADTLTREVTSASPRRKWYELSLDGLKEAAQAVGAIGAPVLAAVAKLVGLLA